MIKLAADKAVAVNTLTVWMPIDEHTPRGAKIQLISSAARVAHYGLYKDGDTFYTHWFPLPVFQKEET